MNTTKLAATSTTPSSDTTGRAARQREVDNALIVQALCERKPTPSTLAQLVRYIAGELNREQAFAGLYVGMS